ncbi:MAG: ketol-acid reductoisomerase [Rubrobacteraceae bacterium]
MTRFFYDDDADVGRLDGREVAIIGYGNQGRTQALNLRDSGVERVLVGSVRDESWDQAEGDGFEVMPISEATRRADILFMLLPDEVAPAVYRDEVEPALSSGKTLNFSSGYNITFGHIVPPESADVVMVAPRMVGDAFRRLYESGKGAPCFVDVNQDSSGEAWEDCLALAKALGCTRAGALAVTFEQETHMDLMAEQGVWPLIWGVLYSAFEVQVEAGLPPEAVVLELYGSGEPAEMFEMAADRGLVEQFVLHSRTSQYGQASRFEELDRTGIRAFLAEALSERITSGRFDEEWTEVQQREEPVLQELLDNMSEHPIIQSEKTLQKNLRLDS